MFHPTAYWLTLLIWTCALPIWAQLPASLQQRQPEVLLSSNYAFDQTARILPMSFASARINLPIQAWERTKNYRQIDLLLTLYPQDPNTWEIGYDNLMQNRFLNLENRIPGILSDTNIHWRIVLQTNCSTLAQARSLFHGFVLFPAEYSSGPVQDSIQTALLPKPRFDSLALQSNLDRIEAIVLQDKGNHDSTALQLFTSHPEWRNSLVVIDWTASMYRQGALLINWQQQPQNRGRIQHFVFFNDGDGKYDDEKLIGMTGGIYDCAADTLPKMWNTIKVATLGGEGGDHRENDLEALLSGIEACPECEQVILIADNSGPVRDMALLPLIEKPVKILLCNAFKDEIETDYLEIAYKTKGSLQTKTLILEDLPTLSRSGLLLVGENQYQQRGGKFSKLRN